MVIGSLLNHASDLQAAAHNLATARTTPPTATYVSFNFCTSHPSEMTFSPPIQQVILGVIGVPGAFLAGWAVEQPYIGRKGTLAISAGEYSVLFTRAHYSTTPRGR